MLYGDNPVEDLKKAFTDPNTGQYNAQQAYQQIQTLEKGTVEQKKDLENYLDYLVQARLQEKYNSLLNNTINYPKWLVEKQTAEGAQMAKVSYVQKLYTDIADSTIKISDKEIEDYVSKHKKDFKQTESRSISYAAFSTLPTGADSAAAKEKLEKVIPAFRDAGNINDYLQSQGVTTYYDGYINGKKIQIAQKDSIFKTPVGAIYGPYLDGGSWSIARVIGVKSMPDTVKVRHILIGTMQQDPQSGQTMQIRDSATAYKLADSLKNAIALGSSFDSLVVRFSDDEGSKAKGGVYDSVSSGQMVPQFNDFIFTNPVGSKGVVNTQFGAHYIEILGQKGSDAAYKVAYLSEPIETSDATTEAADRQAAQFASQARNAKDFDAAAEKLRSQKGFTKSVAQNILPTAAQIPGLGESRQFVKDIYKGDKGEVMAPQKVGSNYVVALITDVAEEGTQTAAQARMMVEPLLRNKKKAEAILKQLGPITTLEAASTKLGMPVVTVDSIRFSGPPSAGLNEQKVIGAAFNKANTGKVITTGIEGSQGVFIVRVDNLTSTSVANANVAQERQQRVAQAKMQVMYQAPPTQALREAATIKDYRSKFY